jgi:hypothetical protein
MTHQFSSGDLAFTGRCKSDDIKRWRKDGLLANIGERRHDAIHFDRVEVVWVAIGHFLKRCGLGLTAGFRVIAANALRQFRRTLPATTLSPNSTTETTFRNLVSNRQLVISLSILPQLRASRFIEPNGNNLGRAGAAGTGAPHPAFVFQRFAA